jgi:hypothetical protein
MYFRHSSDEQLEFLKVFDAASPEECYERNESIVPQQALALANSPLSYTQARPLARRLSQEAGDNKAAESKFLTAAFERILGRPPLKEELTMSQRFLEQQTALFRDPKRMKESQPKDASEVPPSPEPEMRARENLIHTLFNVTDFVTIR